MRHARIIHNERGHGGAIGLVTSHRDGFVFIDLAHIGVVSYAVADVEAMRFDPNVGEFGGFTPVQVTA